MSRYEVKVSSNTEDRSLVWYKLENPDHALYNFCDLLSRMRGAANAVTVTLTDAETTEILQSVVWPGEQKDWFDMFGVNRRPLEGGGWLKKIDPDAVVPPRYEVRVISSKGSHVFMIRRDREEAMRSYCFALHFIGDVPKPDVSIYLVDTETSEMLMATSLDELQEDWYAYYGVEKEKPPEPVVEEKKRYYVPSSSIFKDKDGNYWYNLDCDLRILNHRPKSSDDWQILSRNESEVIFDTLGYSLSNVKTFQDYWVSVTPKLPARIRG